MNLYNDTVATLFQWNLKNCTVSIGKTNNWMHCAFWKDCY